MDENLIKWLFQGPSWIMYNTQTDLLDLKKNDPEVLKTRNKMIQDLEVLSILEELEEWPGPVIKNHKKANLLIHRLSFLADIGLNKMDTRFMAVLDDIMSKQSEEGPFEVIVNIPTVFGGTGKDQSTWILSNAPVIVAALVKAGLEEDSRVQKAIKYLVSLQRENGWPCKAASDLGKFKGPGKKEDPCPYATLNILKALAYSEKYRNTKIALSGVESILGLWENRKTQKPFLFAMGTDFQKLKAPFVWYDILHVLEVLSHFESIYKDSRFIEMLNIIRDKMDAEGRFNAESVWMVYKTWDFGQKKEPSRWITFLVYRILKRSGII